MKHIFRVSVVQEDSCVGRIATLYLVRHEEHKSLTDMRAAITAFIFEWM